MNRTTFLVALALLGAPAALAGQQTADSRIRAAEQRVENAGIPASLLESRVAEGHAKGVPADRIADAVERRASALLRAESALRGAPRLSAADLSAGADAVDAGIDEAPLREVVARARVEDRSVAIAVLTYLHQERGLPVDQALARVTDALGRGPDALRSLPSQARGVGRGGPPEHAGGPAALPAPGEKPGRGKPEGVGKGQGQDPGGPPGNGNGKGRGRPGA